MNLRTWCELMGWTQSVRIFEAYWIVQHDQCPGGYSLELEQEQWEMAYKKFDAARREKEAANNSSRQSHGSTTNEFSSALSELRGALSLDIEPRDDDLYYRDRDW